MFSTLIVTILLLLALMLAWIQVQRAARWVAEQHPEAGPLRLVGGGCGGQGHGHGGGHDAPSPPLRATAEIAPAQGCEACSNTACKPGAPAPCGPAELHPVLQS